MINKEEIIKRLKDLGFDQKRSEDIFVEVSKVIAKQIGSKYSTNISEELKLKINEISEDEKVFNFLKENKENLPDFSLEEFEKIYNETWENYFKHMSN
ncbi:MAG: hypothetical protein WCO35_02290 [Candidatus Nomurabacteria bacterium]